MIIARIVRILPVVIAFCFAAVGAAAQDFDLVELPTDAAQLGAYPASSLSYLTTDGVDRAVAYSFESGFFLLDINGAVVAELGTPDAQRNLNVARAVIERATSKVFLIDSSEEAATLYTTTGGKQWKSASLAGAIGPNGNAVALGPDGSGRLVFSKSGSSGVSLIWVNDGGAVEHEYQLADRELAYQLDQEDYTVPVVTIEGSTFRLHLRTAVAVSDKGILPAAFVTKRGERMVLERGSGTVIGTLGASGFTESGFLEGDSVYFYYFAGELAVLDGTGFALRATSTGELYGARSGTVKSEFECATPANAATAVPATSSYVGSFSEGFLISTVTRKANDRPVAFGYARLIPRAASSQKNFCTTLDIRAAGDCRKLFSGSGDSLSPVSGKPLPAECSFVSSLRSRATGTKVPFTVKRDTSLARISKVDAISPKKQMLRVDTRRKKGSLTFRAVPKDRSLRLSRGSIIVAN